jgi:hypothetical protein
MRAKVKFLNALDDEVERAVATVRIVERVSW